MRHKGKSSSTTKLYKIANLLRNGLRILFLLIFLHWILWFTSYANCVNYQEAIKEENIKKEEEKELKEHENKTKQYQRFTGLFNDKEEKNIGEIEEDVLSQIEEKKKKELGDRKLPRKWGELLPELKNLHREKEEIEGELKKKENPTKEEKETLEKKEKEYKKRFREAKDKTIENIENQLKENKLNITELDDKKSLSQRILRDPLKFFIVSPLNKTSKLLGLQEGNHPFWKTSLEIILKLSIIEIILVLIYYSETIVMWENIEKIRDPHLSVEEKEQLNLEASSLFKYAFFNGCMMVLFTFFLSVHPAFFDRTNPLFQSGKSGTQWLIWAPLIFLSLLLSSISSECLHHGRLLTIQELKTCAAKGWVASLLIALVSMGFMRMAGMSSVGNHLFFFLGGLVRFAINIVRVKVFGHREHFPQRKIGTDMNTKRGGSLRRPYT